MVRPERFELPTYCSGGNRSIQLSYGRAPRNYTYVQDLASSRIVLDSRLQLVVPRIVPTQPRKGREYRVL